MMWMMRSHRRGGGANAFDILNEALPRRDKASRIRRAATRDTLRPPTEAASLGRIAMGWFSQKTSIAGIEIPNWTLALGAIILLLVVFGQMK